MKSVVGITGGRVKPGFVAAGLSMVLAACGSVGRLEPASPGMPIHGTVNRGFLEPHRIELNLDGKLFRGEWRTGPPGRDQLAATRYPHRWHVGQVESVLVAGDGSQLHCRWQTHGVTGEGKCVTGDREYPLLLK
jgi:hypothetical protein